MSDFQIKIENIGLGGLCPGFYYDIGTYGNRNQSKSMVAMDCFSSDFLIPAPSFSSLTNGTQAGAVTTVIKGMTQNPVTTTTAYGVGGAKLYQFSSDTVTSDGTWPHTIDKGAVTGEDGEDVAHYQGALYYSYNHSGSAGDIGKYDLASSFDDDWGSTVPSGAAALTNNPHQMVVGGNDVLYIANGRYVASFDGTTFQAQALDLPIGSVISSMVWNNDRLWIATNLPGGTTLSSVKGSIYIWDGTTTSWELEIRTKANLNALYVKDGTVFVWFSRYFLSGTTLNSMGYIDGSNLVTLIEYGSASTSWYQVTEYFGCLAFMGQSNVYIWGSSNKDSPVRFFHFGNSTYTTTIGGLASPFGYLYVSSNASSNYNLAKNSGGFSTSARWESLFFDISGQTQNASKVTGIKFTFDTLITNTYLDWSIGNRTNTIHSDKISFAKHGGVGSAYFPINKVADEVYISLNYANSSTTDAIYIKNITIYGTR